MSNAYYVEKDFIYIAEMCLGMISEIITCAINSTIYCMCDLPIDKLKRDLKETKIKYSESGAEPDKERAGHEKEIRTLNKQIIEAKYLKDQLGISGLFIEMGIQEIFHGIMATYGAATGVMTNVSPTVNLKGTGELVLKAGKTKTVSTMGTTAASPTIFAMKSYETASFIVKSAVKLPKWGKQVNGLVKDGKDLTKDLNDSKKSEHDKKTDGYRQEIDDNKP